MKLVKKISALLIAGMLTVGSVVPAMASSETDTVPKAQTIDASNAVNEQGEYTISIASTDTHTYTVYQLLKGTLIPGESKLGNPSWGKDADATKDLNKFMEDISKAGLTNVEIDDLANSVLAANASGQGTVNSTTPMNVEPGYYLLVDTTENLADGDAKSLNIVAVFNDITITAKKDTVESEKHVDDQNDSDKDDFSQLKDSADYDIGDVIPYTLTMTLPADYANYKQYKIVFTDDMSKGLTLNTDSVKIFYGAADTAGTAIDFVAGGTSAYENGTVYTYTIDDLKAAQAADGASNVLKALKANDVIKITYTATLNNNAVIGSAGNPNKYKVDFSSNPNQKADGKPETNDTPWDVNIVFTYKTVFNKVDADKNPLTGADFTLYKFVESETGTDTLGEGENAKNGTWTNVTSLGSGDIHPSKVTEAYTKNGKTADNAKFTFAGLDAGVYKLSETTTPAGYNTISDIQFTITATHDLVSEDPKLTNLSGAGGAEFTMTSDLATGSLTSDIENKQGAQLPSTGGIGTTIFYVGGAILVILAAIVLVSKRRMSE